MPTTFTPYYRFRIYNKQTVTKSGKVRIGQYEKLIDIAYKNPNDLVFYCAPCFHTEKEFNDLFNKNQIVDNSTRINCQQFSNSQFQPPAFDINDGDKHFLVFRKDRTSGYICSDAQIITIDNVVRLFIDISQPVGFVGYIGSLYRELLSEEVIETGSVNIFGPNSRLSTLEAVQTLQNYLLAAYDIFWIPLFRT